MIVPVLPRFSVNSRTMAINQDCCPQRKDPELPLSLSCIAIVGGRPLRYIWRTKQTGPRLPRLTEKGRTTAD